MPDPLVAPPAIRPPMQSGPPAGRPVLPADATALRAAAKGLEASFLSTMLQSAGLGAPREAMGGGIGEAQFASFLAEAHADALVRRGGIGLAEAIFESLKARESLEDNVDAAR